MKVIAAFFVFGAMFEGVQGRFAEGAALFVLAVVVAIGAWRAMQ